VKAGNGRNARPAYTVQSVEIQRRVVSNIETKVSRRACRIWNPRNAAAPHAKRWNGLRNPPHARQEKLHSPTSKRIDTRNGKEGYSIAKNRSTGNFELLESADTKLLNPNRTLPLSILCQLSSLWNRYRNANWSTPPKDT